MKISSQDEYGLRILLRIGRADTEKGLSIPQLSELEGLSVAYVGKLTRILRLAGFIESTRGQKGGYILSKPVEEIKINDVLNALGAACSTKNSVAVFPEKITSVPIRWTAPFALFGK